jgi:small subunit ribosomal protein S21
MRDNPQHNRNKLYGSTVFLREGEDVNRALRKLKNKMEDGNKLKDLQKKEFYEKPTTMRKRKAGAAKARWAKKLRDQQLPKKLY